MIFVTGDTHRMLDIKKLDIENFPEQRLLSRKDYLIITGDFGGVWTGNEKDDKVLDLHESKNYTTLFIGGNHENYDALYAYPVEEWMGGKVHRIREHVIHLMNGQIFNIDGKKFFVMGGATSADRALRQTGITWWPQEEPSASEYKEALENLSKADFKVDVILSHTCPESVRRNMLKIYKGFIDYESGVEKFLDRVLLDTEYSCWYTGHIHIDREFPDQKMRILYNSVVKL